LNTSGRHLIVEYTGCDRAILDDRERIQALMVQAAEAARTTVVACLFKSFQPQGVTGVVVLEESHLSIHTWPEHSYAAVDFFTCGQGAPERAHEVLFDGLRAGRAERLLVHRGLGESQTMIVQAHEAQHKNP
jgi:S-adenosylmethionine decarboxylase proenzyme